MAEKFITFVKKNIKWILFIGDILGLLVAFVFASYLKFDAPSLFDTWFEGQMYYILTVDIIVTVLMMALFKIYKIMWQFVVITDYLKLFKAFVIAKIITCGCFFYIWSTYYLGMRYTRSFFTWMFIYSFISLSFMLIGRLAVFAGYRKWRKILISREGTQGGKLTNVMIIGAGNAAFRLISELNRPKFAAKYKVVALIDDNKRKHNEYLGGIKIVGGRDKIVETAKALDVDEIFFAVPSASETTKKDILKTCSETGCTLKTLPGITNISQTENISTALRKVDYTDLLGREQIKPDLTKVFELLRNKTVFVSGGGGSIGSELVRQIAKSGVTKRIIIFDIAENGAYDIQQEIKRTYPQVDLKVLIGSVRDPKRIAEIFDEYKPDIVYHAAAHKHVPLMEDSPKEAVKNNVLGTYNLASMADAYGVKRFVMISTDKAVNPTNVMGATKRVCEMIVQSFNKTSETEFVAVRFGNVLGSNGSVIPLFKEQIENGGPVTVTHPDIIRYFMLIPEAVSLVLQAGAYAKGGEIFILDMGSPVKIRELAENLIRLAGYTPGVDMEIKYTGLREGEKLYEELLISEEGIQKTENDLIYIARPMEFDSEKLFEKINYAKEIVETASGVEIVEIIKELVPTFQPNNDNFRTKEEKAETVSV